jgi:hypothetical protein
MPGKRFHVMKRLRQKKWERPGKLGALPLFLRKNAAPAKGKCVFEKFKKLL